jgi:hypothetical protein
MSKPNIELHVEPGVVLTWEDFCATKPSHSIALDGFVDSAPRYCPVGPYANFDHHRDVHRLATRSTVGQILVAVGLGLFETFCCQDAPFANVYVNDCDQDICLSYWLLKNADCVRELTLEQDIARLIIGEDLLDCSAGAYPIDPNRPLARKMAWVYQRYDEARASRRRHEMSGEQIRELIESICERLTLLSHGKAEERELIGEYTILGGGENWRLISEQGTYARTKLFADGIRAFVAVRERDGETYDYSVGRMSPFIPFPLSTIFDELNEIEGCIASQDRWGGSDTIGGSPRKKGSRLSPAEIATVINRILTR